MANENEDGYQAIIIDSGSYEVKATITGRMWCEDEPFTAVRSIVTLVESKTKVKELFLGIIPYVENEKKFEIIQTIKRGIITNWKALELIWSHMFYNQLKVDPTKHFVLLAEPVLNPKQNRERMVQLAFDSFGFIAIAVVLEVNLAMYGLKLSIGMSVTSGHDLIQVLPIYTGYGIIHAIRRIKLGGSTINSLIKENIKHLFSNSNKLDLQNIVEKIKRNHCFIPQSKEHYIKRKNEVFEFQTDNQKKVLLNSSICSLPEVLFSPHLFGFKNLLGMHEIVNDSIQSLAIDIKLEICQRIVVSGGNKNFNGLNNRLQKELQSLIPNLLDIRVPQHSRIHAALSGGTVLATQAAFQDSWLLKGTYLSEGKEVIHDYCLT